MSRTVKCQFGPKRFISRCQRVGCDYGAVCVPRPAEAAHAASATPARAGRAGAPAFATTIELPARADLAHARQFGSYSNLP